MESPKQKLPSANVTLAISTSVFAFFNIGLMMMYASSLLGPVPLQLIELFIGVTFLAAISMVPVYFIWRSSGLKLTAAFLAAVVFYGLVLFNFWILMSASAAV